MIRRIEIENFMSLRNMAVDLEPLTIFIGPNGSGKSAIFKALVTLAKLANGAPLRGRTGEFNLEGVTLDDIAWTGNPALPIRFRVWFDDDGDDPGYVLELNKRAAGWSVIRERIRIGGNLIEVDEGRPFSHPTEGGRDWMHVPPLQGSLRYRVHRFLNDSSARPAVEPILQLTQKLGQAYRYRPSASDIASFVSPPTEAEQKFFVRQNGYGVAVELQALQGSNRELFERIERAVCHVFPHIRAIGFKMDWQGVRLSYKTDRSAELIPAPQESDGVLLATFLFWRLYSGDPSLKVCLEEPENGLHPFLLADRFRVLKEFAYGQNGSRVQLLVATHSPEFLRAVKAHPTALWKEIRVVEFAPSTGTLVRRLSNFREATHLIDEYLEEVHRHWERVAKSWEPTTTT